MPFDDLPEIDQSAKNSELSERRFTDLFNLNSGFIPRADVPDKGCDFDVELVQERTGATNWRFPVQLKSIERPTLINGGEYLSYPFKTSRLGYLIRRKPSIGLIVLYDVESDVCYYDFADEIYQRLCLERDSDDWKKHEEVHIHFPVSHVLTVNAAAHIHTVFLNRFMNNEKMHEDHGKAYGLPTMKFATGLDFDFTQPKEIKRFLTEYGMLMLGNYDVDILYEMIASLPNSLIYGDKDLMFMAAIAYSETALYPDSNLFLEKLKRFSLTEAEQLNLRFVQLKNQLALGYIDSNRFLELLKTLPLSAKDDVNSVIIALNILRYELSKYSSLEKNGLTLLAHVEELFTRIDQIQANVRQKTLMSLWNMENLSFVIHHINLEEASEVHIKESLGATIPLAEKRSYILENLRLEQQFTARINSINGLAAETKDDLLKAYSMALHVHHFTQQMINLLSFGRNIHLMTDLIPQINLAVSAAVSSYNLFYKQHLYKEAYNSLCSIIELQQFGMQYFSMEYNLRHSLPELRQVKIDMEDNLGLTPFNFVLESLPIDSDSEKPDPNLSFTARLSDKEIDVLAEYMRESLNLSQERLANIKGELIAYRLFNQRCKDENILLLTFKSSYEQQHPYITPTRFVLRSKKTNVETVPSVDMLNLLESLGW